jgi:integrase
MSNPFLSPARGQSHQPFNGWSKSKAALDKLSGVTGWTLHDLRRTYATNMARLGVQLPVIERLLNHVSGSFAGVVGIYQHHSFMPEMRNAVERYEQWLAALIN